MTTVNFDSIFAPQLVGHVADPEVIDPDGDPNHTLQIALPYTVKLKWDLQGTDADSLGGTWKVKISLESLGEEFEGPVWQGDTVYSNVDAGSTSTNQMWHIDAVVTNPTTDPDPKKNVTAGVYMLGVQILFYNEHDKPKAMAAFSTGPTLAFYDPGT